MAARRRRAAQRVCYGVPGPCERRLRQRWREPARRERVCGQDAAYDPLLRLATPLRGVSRPDELAAVTH